MLLAAPLRAQGPVRGPVAPLDEQYVLTLEEVPAPSALRTGAYRLGTVSSPPIVVLEVATAARMSCTRLNAVLIAIGGPRRYELRLERTPHRERFCEETAEPPRDTVHLPATTGAYQLDVVAGPRRDRYRYTVSQHHAVLRPASGGFTRVTVGRLQRVPHQTIAIICGTPAFGAKAVGFDRDGLEQGHAWACRLFARLLRDSLSAYVLPLDTTAGALPFVTQAPRGFERLRLVRFAHPKGPEPYYAADVERVRALATRFHTDVLLPYAPRSGLRVLTWEGEVLLDPDRRPVSRP